MNPTVRTILTRPFSPSQIPGLALWLDASRSVLASVGPDVPAAAGGTVRCWKDQSGNAVAMDQPTGTLQPLLSASAWRNGRPSVNFDGVNDQLFTATSLLPAGTGTYTILTVADYVSAAGVVLASAAGGSVVQYTGLIYRPSASLTGFYHGAGATGALAAAPSADTGAAVRSYRLGTSLLEHRKAGSLLASASRIASSVAGAGFYLGSAAAIPMNMAMGECLVFNRALSDPELTKLEAWLASRYGL